MDKKHIIASLTKKKKGVYNMIVKIYDAPIELMPLAIALDFIQEDLGKESGTKIELNYFSFAHAVYRSKKKLVAKTQINSNLQPSQKPHSNWNFRDSNEIPNDQPRTGTFNGAKQDEKGKEEAS